jgi:hypothetical protein
MSEIREHRDLDAWRVAMDAVLETYRLSADFPNTEIYGLTSQMRRAADLQKLIVSARPLVHGLRRAKRLHLAASVGAPAGLLLLTFRLLT